MSIHWKNTKKAFVFKLSCCSMFSISAVLNSTLFNSSTNTSSKINFLTFEMLHWLLLLVLLFQLAILRRRKKNLQIAMTVQFLPITLAQLCSKIKEYYLGLIDKVFSLNQGVLFRQNTFYFILCNIQIHEFFCQTCKRISPIHKTLVKKS